MSMGTHGKAKTRGCLWGLILCVTAFAGNLARADDPTFRPFPASAAPPFPREFAERLYEQMSRRSTLMPPGSTPEKASPELPLELERLAPEAFRNLGPAAPPKEETPRFPERDAPPPNRPQRKPSPNPAPSENRSPALPGNVSPPEKAPPKSPPSSPRTPQPEVRPVPRSPSPQERRRAAPPSTEPNRPSVTPPREPERNERRPAFRPPVREENEPPQTNRRARDSRKELNEALNKILMEAATQANRPEVAQAAFGESSRESFLNPLIRRAQQTLAEQGRDFRPRVRWGRRQREAAMNTARRLNLSVSVPEAPSGAALRSAAGTARWFIAPVLFIAAVLLLIPLWRRYGERLSARLRRASPRSLLPGRRVNSPAGLVQAVDSFLVLQFGAAASWWHCRAVERALTRLAPELSGDIARLVGAYEQSRYGPPARPVSSYELEQAGQTLRRLAGLAGEEHADRAGI
ncbi:MAG: hypothetical protein KY475_24375 [Planctomycetes bacterium]|nr:hypothetical protein [Planctomycetota bacterium]